VETGASILVTDKYSSDGQISVARIIHSSDQIIDTPLRILVSKYVNTLMERSLYQYVVDLAKSSELNF